MQREEKRGLTLRAKSFSPSVGSAAKQNLANKRKIGKNVLKVNGEAGDFRELTSLHDKILVLIIRSFILEGLGYLSVPLLSSPFFPLLLGR